VNAQMRSGVAFMWALVHGGAARPIHGVRGSNGVPGDSRPPVTFPGVSPPQFFFTNHLGWFEFAPTVLFHESSGVIRKRLTNQSGAIQKRNVLTFCYLELLQLILVWIIYKCLAHPNGPLMITYHKPYIEISMFRSARILDLEHHHKFSSIKSHSFTLVSI
jgi:hypothetical protein